jgi:hypothetical protein
MIMHQIMLDANRSLAPAMLVLVAEQVWIHA